MFFFCGSSKDVKRLSAMKTARETPRDSVERKPRYLFENEMHSNRLSKKLSSDDIISQKQRVLTPTKNKWFYRIFGNTKKSNQNVKEFIDSTSSPREKINSLNRYKDNRNSLNTGKLWLNTDIQKPLNIISNSPPRHISDSPSRRNTAISGDYTNASTPSKSIDIEEETVDLKKEIQQQVVQLQQNDMNFDLFLNSRASSDDSSIYIDLDNARDSLVSDMEFDIHTMSIRSVISHASWRNSDRLSVCALTCESEEELQRIKSYMIGMEELKINFDGTEVSESTYSKSYPPTPTQSPQQSPIQTPIQTPSNLSPLGAFSPQSSPFFSALSSLPIKKSINNSRDINNSRHGGDSLTSDRRSLAIYKSKYVSPRLTEDNLAKLSSSSDKNNSSSKKSSETKGSRKTSGKLSFGVGGEVDFILNPSDYGADIRRYQDGISLFPDLSLLRFSRRRACERDEDANGDKQDEFNAEEREEREEIAEFGEGLDPLEFGIDVSPYQGSGIAYLYISGRA